MKLPLDQTPALNIRPDLIEAYIGINERELRKEFDQHVKAELAKGTETVFNYPQWVDAEARRALVILAPKTRLSIYLEWNGILGYTQAIWDISQGKLV